MIDAGEKKLASPCDLLIRGVISGALLGAATTVALTGVVTAEVGALILPVSPGYFAFGFEHAVVNMFVIPTGIMLGAKVGLESISGHARLFLTGLAPYVTCEPAKQ